MEQLTKVRAQFLAAGFIAGAIVVGAVVYLKKVPPPRVTKHQKPPTCTDVSVYMTPTGADDFDLCANNGEVIWKAAVDANGNPQIKGCEIHFNNTPFGGNKDFDCDKKNRSGKGKCDVADACYYKYNVTIIQTDGSKIPIDPGGSVWQ